jgi:hypothetical protein
VHVCRRQGRYPSGQSHEFRLSVLVSPNRKAHFEITFHSAFGMVRPYKKAWSTNEPQRKQLMFARVVTAKMHMSSRLSCCGTEPSQSGLLRRSSAAIRIRFISNVNYGASVHRGTTLPSGDWREVNSPREHVSPHHQRVTIVSASRGSSGTFGVMTEPTRPLAQPIPQHNHLAARATFPTNPPSPSVSAILPPEAAQSDPLISPS